MTRHVRNATAGDKLTEIINEVETIARIANGHLVQSILVSDSAKVDVIVQQILQMGSVTLQQLVDLKLETITDANKAYQRLATELVKDQETKDSEEGILSREKIRQNAKKIRGGLKLTGVDDYKNSLDVLKGVKIDETFVEKLHKALKDLVDQIQSMKPNTLSSLEVSEFGMNSKRLGFIVDSLKNFGPIHTGIKSLKSSITFPNFLTALKAYTDEEVNFRNQRIADVAADKLLANSNKLNDAFKNSKVWADLIEELVTSRQPNGRNIGNYVVGLPNGPKDLMKLETDSADGKLMKAIKAKPDTSKHIVISFAPIRNFTTELSSLDVAWQSTTEMGAAEKMKMVKENIAFMGAPPDLSKTIKELTECTIDLSQPPPNRPALLKLTDETQALHMYLSQISSFENVSELNFDTFKTELNVTATNDNEKLAELKAKLQKWDTNEAFKTAMTQLTKLKHELEALKTFVEQKEAKIQKVNTELSNMNTILQDLANEEFSKYLDCLAKVSDEDGKSLDKMIRLVREMRDSPSSPEMAAGFSMAEAVVNSRKTIEKVRKVGKEMKGMKNKQMEALKVLPESTVKQLGMAGRGLATIQQLQASKSRLTKYSTMDVSSIITEAENKNLANSTIDTLKTMPAVQTSLMTLLAEIEQFNTAIQSFNAEDVTSYGSVFDEAAKIQPVTVNAEEIVAALVTLQRVLSPSTRRRRSVDTDISDAVDGLRVLVPLDLNYANYNFSGVTPSLQEFQLTFVNFQKAVNAGFGNGTQSSAQGSTESESWISKNWHYCLIGAGIVGCVALGTVYSIKNREKIKTKIRKLKKPKNNKDPEKGDSTETGESKVKSGSISNEKNEDPGNSVEEKDDKKKKKKDKKKSSESKSAESPAKPDIGLADVPGNQKKEGNDDDVLSLDQTQVSEREPPCFVLAKNICDAISSSRKNPRKWLKETLDTTNASSAAGVAVHTADKDRQKSETVLCREDTRVVLLGHTTDFIHANKMQIDDDLWIMCQGPVYEADKTDTLEDHLHMMFQMKVTVCIQLCKFEENGKIQCAPYYASCHGPNSFAHYPRFYGKAEYKHDCGLWKHFKKYNIENLECFKTDFEDVSRKSIPHPTDPSGIGTAVFRLKDSLFCHVMRYFNWAEYGLPPSPKILVDIHRGLDEYFEKDEKRRRTFLVNCSTGIGRSGCFVAYKKGVSMMKTNMPLTNVVDLVTAMNACRLNAIETPEQLLYVHMAIIKYFMEEDKISFNEWYCQLEYYLSKMNEYKNAEEWKTENPRRLEELIAEDKTRMESYVAAERAKAESSNLVTGNK